MIERTLLLFLVIISIHLSCSGPSGDQEALPILGNKHTEEKIINGNTVINTVYHKIAPFELINQDGERVNNETVKGKVYVADFFFTSCPTICPIMKKEMLRVYEKFNNTPDFKILSHTIDPEYDSVALLKDFSLRLGVENSNTWNFLTGDQEHIFELGQTSYLTTAMENKDEPGGFLHSGAFVLVDQMGRIRGVYDGTKEKEVNRLIKDIPKLFRQDEIEPA
ncbi:MAG: SCO family protein [Cyclobacteriaceae bacterium]